ncbi:cytochrome c class I [Hydrogenophaga taeniospiralis CCUG 15921]|uniref:Cytochrome c class I n=1 Tax=Hydrogenophaga taeniospiralis CCUG 15921 TaxID=1281780 RepID=A0A9X4NN59_9BURK|nr:cytochrome c class I [Hydrogenophaga taeniospiralis CCUG 15921]
MKVTQWPRSRVLHTGLIALTAACALVACGGATDSDSNAGLTRSKTARTDPASPGLETQANTNSGTALTTTETSTDVADLASPQGLSKDSSGGRIVQPKNTEGRLLASNCFQCHGTMGSGGFENIRGGEAEEVLEYMTKTASRDIMAAHAQGYTTAQLQKIITYLQQ